jgi:hypothetical protein
MALAVVAKAQQEVHPPMDSMTIFAPEHLAKPKPSMSLGGLRWSSFSCSRSLGAHCFSFGRIVFQKFLDEIDVGHDHSPAAVATEFEFVHSGAGVPLC